MIILYTFITDSGCDLPENLKLPFELKVLPLRVYLEKQEYEDKFNINAKELYEFELGGKIATTSLPKPERIKITIEESARESDKVFVITISEKLSNTHDLIKNIVSSMNLKNVYVFDSKSASVKQGYIILRAMEHVKNGYSLTQNDIDKFEQESLLAFLVPTLEYLHKGGRIGKAKAFIGKMLSLKPILTTDSDGEVNTLGTARSMESGISSIQSIMNRFLESNGFSNDFSIIGAYTIDSMKQHIEKLLSPYKKNLLGLTNVGSAIAAHVGPEAFGVVIGKGVHLE
ncbi:MAG: DegV family protein [Fervidobacterium sp.]